MRYESVKIKATFIGEDGSMGFKNQKTYLLTLTQHGELIHIVDNDQEQKPNKGWCKYSNMMTFLMNWKNISAKYFISKF